MSERVRAIRSLDLPPSEKMMFAGKVNKVCSLDATSFNPETDIGLASEIVNVLDPKLEVSTYNVDVKITGSDNKSNSQIVGRTNLGDVKMSVDGDKEEYGFHLGKEHAIGIGEYIVKKIGKRTTRALTFSHFLDYEAGFDPELRRVPSTIISYFEKTKEVYSIDKEVPVIRNLGFMLFVTHKRIPVWFKK